MAIPKGKQTDHSPGNIRRNGLSEILQPFKIISLNSKLDQPKLVRMDHQEKPLVPSHRIWLSHVSLVMRKPAPAYQRSLISAFVVHCQDRIKPILAKSKISRLYLDSLAEQAGLSLTWSENPKTGFLVMWLMCPKQV